MFQTPIRSSSSDPYPSIFSNSMMRPRFKTWKQNDLYFFFHLIYFFIYSIVLLTKKDNKKVYEDYIIITGLFFENWYWNIQTILLSDKFYKEGIQSWWSKNLLLEKINRSSKHTRINWWFHVYFPGSWCYKIKTLANVSFTCISNGNL